MARVLSALLLLFIVVAVVWLLPPLATLVLVEVVTLVASLEYTALAYRLRRPMSRPFVVVAAMASCAALARPGARVEIVVMAAVVTGGALVISRGRDADALSDAATAIFAPVYLGLPLGALAALQAVDGREVVLLLLLTVMASDTAQYYGGRWLGRRLLAPAISPKKTVEGALLGLVAGTSTMIVGGRWWLTTAGPLTLGLLGATVSLVGIAGDLFESMIKRGAGVKDASGLIPGHGGMLDRIDSLLFAAPVYYAVVRLAL